ncbi:MAG: hypothetical protein JNM17_02645 [Archangium sp.]|nr:hypothetical protein [Archangium sp.]
MSRLAFTQVLFGTRRVQLAHGDFIGRQPSAALFVDDPRVSEGHAVCVLRRGQLWLLALRRLLAVGGRPVSEVALAPGQHIDLAPGLTVLVEEVTVPPTVLALAAEGQPARVLGQVVSLFEHDDPRMVYVANAAAHVWTAGDECFVRLGVASPARRLVLGEKLRVGAREWTLSLVPSSAASSTPTGAGPLAPLRVVVYFDSVVLERADAPPLTMGGVSARIISELATRTSGTWEEIARAIWVDVPAPDALRHRWDVSLSRLRARLREASMREDLVRTDKAGRVSLVIEAKDLIEDRS